MSSENRYNWVCPDCGCALPSSKGYEPKPCGGLWKVIEAEYEKSTHDRHSDCGVKHDDGKPRTDLLPAGALLEVARVLEHGAKKYGDNNWRNVQPRSRYIGALLRHLFAWMEGEKLDKESGLNHVYHAACCALFLAQWEHEDEEAV